RAKLAQTTLAEALCAAAGLPLTVLRPFNLVSPRLPPSSALGNMREQLLRGHGRERVVECGRLEVVRDFVPLPAVAETIRRLTVSPAPGRTINVCTGIGIELGAILRAMAERLWGGFVAVPTAPRVVGDPTILARLTGIRIEATPEGMAEVLLG